jgi:hypothetical protein
VALAATVTALHELMYNEFASGTSSTEMSAPQHWWSAEFETCRIPERRSWPRRGR